MNKIKHLFLILIINWLTISVWGQSAVVPAGGTAYGNGGSISYTVGQIADQRAEGNDKYIIEGVQQPFEIQVVGIDKYPAVTLEAIVYPNPTSNKVMLSIRKFDIPSYGLTAQLYDFNGKLIQTLIIKDLDTEIDFSTYAASTYQLRLLNQKVLIKTFKVVKNSL